MSYAVTKEKMGRYKDFPVGLQVVGQRQMEAKLMKAAAVVEACLNG